jgi:hypothetical protein
MLYSKYEDYPSGCPPASASEIKGCFYRVVGRLKRCKKKDFKSLYEKLGLYNNDGDKCDQRSISVYSVKEDVENLVLQHPGMPHFIAELDLCGDHGVLLNYPDESDLPSHYNWWKPQGLDCTKYCQNIYELKTI